MKITEIAFTVYTVSDIKKSREFYEKKLRLNIYEIVDYGQEGGSVGDFWIEYAVGEAIFAITNSFESSKQSGIAFEVENFDEAVSFLKNAGVPFITDRINSPVCCLVLIADPDGNEITIHKRNPEASNREE